MIWAVVPAMRTQSCRPDPRPKWARQHGLAQITKQHKSCEYLERVSNTRADHKLANKQARRPDTSTAGRVKTSYTKRASKAQDLDGRSKSTPTTKSRTDRHLSHKGSSPHTLTRARTLTRTRPHTDGRLTHKHSHRRPPAPNTPDITNSYRSSETDKYTLTQKTGTHSYPVYTKWRALTTHY